MMRLSDSELTTEIWKKINAYHQQKCSPGTLRSAGIRFMRIFLRVPWWGDLKRLYGGRNRPFFFVISVAISSEAFELKSKLSCGVMKCLYWLSSDPKNAWHWMTLRRHFMLKFVFIVGLTRFFCLAFGDNYVETNEDTAILSATKMFANDSGFLQHKVNADINVCLFLSCCRFLANKVSYNQFYTVNCVRVISLRPAAAWQGARVWQTDRPRYGIICCNSRLPPLERSEKFATLSVGDSTVCARETDTGNAERWIYRPRRVSDTRVLLIYELIYFAASLPAIATEVVVAWSVC